MPNLNRVFLMGRLTRDPQLRYTPQQTAVCDLGMAINRKFKDKEETCFVDLTCWGKTAENVAKYLKKGSGLLVEGRLNFRQWTGPDGKKRSKLDVTAESVQFLGTPDASAPGRLLEPESPSAKAPSSDANEAGDDVPDGDDTIPF